MNALYRALPLSLPLPTCRKVHRPFSCSSSSAASAGSMDPSPPPSPQPWQSPVSQQFSSEALRTHSKKRLQKRLQIAGVDQEELVDPWLLADADSRFAELHGVHIHYKITNPPCAAEEEEEEEGMKVHGSGLESDTSSLSSSSSTSTVSSPSSLPPASSSSSSSSRSAQTLSPACQSHSSTSLSSSMPPNAASSSNPLPSSADPTPSPSDTVTSSAKPFSSMPQPSSSHIPAILLHGFGASLFSWERVLRPLAKVLGSQVIAFDRPAFGLTTRIEVPLGTRSASGNDDHIPVPLNPYSVSFSSLATIAFIDFVQSSKAVLIGHSAGCIVAADAYFKAPERIAAIIMVAPALVAPISLYKKAEKRQEQNMLSRVFLNIWAKIVWAFSIIGAMVQVFSASIKLLWYRLLAAILRSDFGCWLIRIVMDKLSLKAVRLAWYDKGKVDEYVIAGYTKPLKCRDWERALLEYIIALAGSPSSDDKQAPLSRRLEDIKCPVLVITGDSDFIVPAWNAERLAKVLPNAQFHVIKNCGHVPHEEKPEEFVTLIKQFMQRVLHGAPTEPTPNDSMVFMPA